jgi:protein O-mannosyl-transferase
VKATSSKQTSPKDKKGTHKSSQPAPKPGWPHSLRTETLVVGLLIAVATVAVYFPVRHHPFVKYDDGYYVVDNPHIKSGLDWDTTVWAFTTFYQANWHPLTWLSHALDVQMFQLDAGAHHQTNLWLHVVNVLLLFWVLRKATGYIGRSALVAALFALHPINVETVAWVAERKNLLSMLFFLLALGAWRWYVREPRVGRYAMVALLYALGLMAKPQVITFPFVLLLWDYWPLRRMANAGPDISSPTLPAPDFPARSFLWLVKEKIPLFAICAASVVVTFLAQRSGGAVASLERYGLFVRLATAIVAYAQYVGKAFWPTRLAPFYPHPWDPLPPLPAWEIPAALLFLLAVSGLVFAARSRRYLLTGWLWFVGTLVPMIGLVQVGNQAMADRYAYLPFIGLFIMICWGVADLAEQRHLPRALLPSVSVVVLIALTVLTYRQVGYWNDGLTLWSHTLQVTTSNVIAEDDLAQALAEQGQPEEGMKHFRAALAISPSDHDGNLQIAQYDHQHGRMQEALERYDKMLSLTQDPSDRAVLFSNRGFVYRDLGDYGRARQSFEAAIALNPGNFRTWMGLGVVTQKMGDLNVAIRDYSRANELRPSDIGYLLLARALEQSGRKDEADAATRRAKLISPNVDAARVVANGLIDH